MTLEEKRALHIEISQLLADANINQNTIKQMVEEAINKKVEKAIDNYFSNKADEHITDEIIRQVNRFTAGRYLIDTVEKILKNKILHVELKDIEVIKNDK